MDYVLVAFISIAILRGIFSLAMGLWWFIRLLKANRPEPGDPRAVIVRSTVPSLIGAVLAILYFKLGLTAYPLLFSAALLYGCELGVTVFIDRRRARQTTG